MSINVLNSNENSVEPRLSWSEGYMQFRNARHLCFVTAQNTHIYCVL